MMCANCDKSYNRVCGVVSHLRWLLTEGLVSEAEFLTMAGSNMDPNYEEVIGTIEIRIADLVEVDATDQQKFMRDWFLDNFEDPVHSLPYVSREGGYIWIYGGPYDPHEELHEKFGDLVPEELIEEVADELFAECHEWAAQSDPSDDDFYGLDNPDEPAEYFNEYCSAMDSNRAMLALEVPDSVRNTFHGIVFVNLITIMETYLSDTLIGLVTHSEKSMRTFVVTTPEFKERKLSIAEIFESIDKMPETAKKYLEAVVWHRLSVVRNMYRDTLGVSFPDRLDDVFRAIEVRHALVHRNGKIEGEYVAITRERIQELAREIDHFIRSVHQQVMRLDHEELFF